MNQDYSLSAFKDVERGTSFLRRTLSTICLLNYPGMPDRGTIVFKVPYVLSRFILNLCTPFFKKINLHSSSVCVFLLLVSSCATVPVMTPVDIPSQDIRLEITKAMLVAGGRLVEIRYRIVGDIKARPLNPKETYIVDEATGEIIFVERPPRLMGGLRQMPPSYIIFPNNGIIKKGSNITVVIGGIRQEHISVEEVTHPY